MKLKKRARILKHNFFVALNDRNKFLDGKSLRFITLSEIPRLNVSKDVPRTISLIDVLLLNKESKKIAPDPREKEILSQLKRPTSRV